MARKRKAQILNESSSESESSEQESSEETSSESESTDDSSSDEEQSNKETIAKLLEPFTKPQIIDLLKSASSTDSKLLSSITQIADSDPTHRKIFIHGLSWDATSDQIIDTFKPFGEIQESKLVTDKLTGKAKGYAFVLFKTRAAARKALRVPQKMIGNRVCSCQLASAGPTGGGTSGSGSGVSGLDVGSRKMYVGNVGPNVNPEKLKEFFRRYGEIEELPIGVDFVTNRFKGFAVITFRSVEGFRKAMEEPIKVFENCQLHCKKFTEKENRSNGNVASSNNNNNSSNNVGVGNGNSSQVSLGMGQQVANAVPGYGNMGGLGMSNPMLGAGFNTSGLLMGQNLGMGLGVNPMLGAGYNPAGMMGAGLSAPFAGMGSGYGVNGISSGVLPVMGNYGAQAALQGLGPFQNPLLPGELSLGTSATTTATTTATVRASESGVKPPKSFTAYFRR